MKKYLILLIINSSCGFGQEEHKSEVESFHKVKRTLYKFRKLRLRQIFKSIRKLEDIVLILNYKSLAQNTDNLKLLNRVPFQVYKELYHVIPRFFENIIYVVKKDLEQLRGLDNVVEAFKLKIES